MDSSSQFLLTYSIFLMGVVSPGPDAIVLLKTAIQSGRRPAFYVAFGLGLSVFVVCLSILLGLPLLFEKIPFLIYLVQYGGSIFLIYLGVQSLRSPATQFEEMKKKSTSSETIDVTVSQLISLRNGFMTNFLNPFAILYLISFLSVRVSPTTPVLYKLLFCFCFGVTYVGWNMILSFIPTNRWLKGYFDRYAGLLGKVSGGLLIFIGLKYAFKSLI